MTDGRPKRDEHPAVALHNRAIMQAYDEARVEAVVFYELVRADALDEAARVADEHAEIHANRRAIEPHELAPAHTAAEHAARSLAMEIRALAGKAHG